jgi:hypothetical protein
MINKLKLTQIHWSFDVESCHYAGHIAGGKCQRVNEKYIAFSKPNNLKIWLKYNKPHIKFKWLIILCQKKVVIYFRKII